MKEPAKCGLFTVCEMPEVEGDVVMADCSERRLRRAEREGIEVDVPRDADSADEEFGLGMDLGRVPPSINDAFSLANGFIQVDLENRLSWVTSDSSATGSTASEHDASTPMSEEDDPFAHGAFALGHEQMWGHAGGRKADEEIGLWRRGVRMEDQGRQRLPIETHGRPRPPPLNLDFSRYRHPFCISPEPETTLLTPRSSISRPSTFTHLDVFDLYRSSSGSVSPPSPPALARGSLLPAHPILSSDEWAAESPLTPTVRTKRESRLGLDSLEKAQHVDLVSVLEDLYTSCGEDSSDPEMDSPASAQNVTARKLEFPLPPFRSTLRLSTSSGPYSPRTPPMPHTPPRTSQSAHPTPALADAFAPKSRSRSYRPGVFGLENGDHSFLRSLSMSDEGGVGGGEHKSRRSGSMTSSSGSGGRRLPKRAGLPGDWMFGQGV
jgi:hypothetical protein